MSTVNNKDRELTRILSYGMVEAPAELELMVKKIIAEESVFQPKRTYMGIVAGWVPAVISVVGFMFGIITSIFVFFPQFGGALEVVNKVLSFIVSPTVMMIALSVIVLILVDSLFEKRLGKTAIKLG